MPVGLQSYPCILIPEDVMTSTILTLSFEDDSLVVLKGDSSVLSKEDSLMLPKGAGNSDGNGRGDKRKE
jgi:hypothetical protein